VRYAQLLRSPRLVGEARIVRGSYPIARRRRQQLPAPMPEKLVVVVEPPFASWSLMSLPEMSPLRIHHRTLLRAVSAAMPPSARV